MKLLCLAVLQTLVLASPCASLLLPLQAQSSQAQSSKSSPQYVSLPPLREQAILQDGWTAERLAQVPSLLRKHGVDAWLMSQKEYAEDTVFWSQKSAKQFSARRRTTKLFLAEPTLGGTYHSWVDNTPAVWKNLVEVLEAGTVSSIAVNVDADIAFSSGLHAGEYALIVQQLGPEWSEKLVNVPMLGVEFVATQPESKLEWYRKLQETAWAMISGAFSERVITPGKTSTEVWHGIHTCWRASFNCEAGRC